MCPPLQYLVKAVLRLSFPPDALRCELQREAPAGNIHLSKARPQQRRGNILSGSNARRKANSSTVGGSVSGTLEGMMGEKPVDLFTSSTLWPG